MDGGDSVTNGDVSIGNNRFTHEVKAGLSLRLAHMGFFVVLLMHSSSIVMNRALRKPCSL